MWLTYFPTGTISYKSIIEPRWSVQWNWCFSQFPQVSWRQYAGNINYGSIDLTFSWILKLLSSQCEYRQLRNAFTKNNFVTAGWTRGAYQCLCKTGYYSIRHPHGFNGTVMEIALVVFEFFMNKTYEWQHWFFFK